MHLVSVPEIADMLGVSQQRVHQIIKAYSDFPLPEAELAIGRVWLRSGVEEWAGTHPRRSGRPSVIPTPTVNDANASDGGSRRSSAASKPVTGQK
jgi:predicted DNA-binding transcriptional regulator AlpA